MDNTEAIRVLEDLKQRCERDNDPNQLGRIEAMTLAIQTLKGRQQPYNSAVRVIKNMCENEDEARKIAKEVLTEHEVEGDSYGVPTIQEVVGLLVNKIRGE